MATVDLELPISRGMAELDIYVLTDEQKSLQEAAKQFATDVLRPAATQLDILTPEEVVAEGSVLWDVFRKAHSMGFHARGFPEEVGGLGLDPLSQALIGEQWGWGASDLAVSLGASTIPFATALLSPDPDVQSLAAQFCADEEGKMIGCWAITEPDHGSDMLLYREEHSGEAAWAPSVRAVLDGPDYVITSQKSAWVSNGTIATHAALFACLDPSKGMRACGIAVVPLDLPGVTRGKPLDKMGQRALNQGEIFFNEVRIPKEYMICSDPETYAMLSDLQLAGANAGMGTAFTGVAQAAYDEALAYARQRVQGGKAIIGHQNIKLKLFDMFMRVEAARALSRKVAVYNSLTQPPALHYSIASKIMCTQTAFHVASEAITIHGGVGLTKEYPIEKIFRDARASLIEDGVNETLALAGADWL